MTFDDLEFRRMETYSPCHGPGELQARASVAGVDISVRRGGSGLAADAEHPYEVLVDDRSGRDVFGFMTSRAIDDLMAHIENHGSAEGFKNSQKT